MKLLIHSMFLSLLLIGANWLAAEDAIIPSPELPKTTPWNLTELSKPPAMEWIDEKSPVRSLLYAGEAFRDKPTQVFAYYATPATITGNAEDKGPWPAVVLVHGGGGTAFSQWVTLWAKRGYAAIAMDLGGARPDPAAANTKKNVVRLENGGPDQGHPAKFETIKTEDISDDWPYHAVANVIRAHSLLRTMPGVDAKRTALTGISWGGYTTCLVASLDTRFKAAVPVYGCGHLQDNSTWLGEFAKLGPEKTKHWVELYDPSSYLPACRVPMFFVNGTNDFAYPLDSYMKCYDEVKHAPKNIRIQVKMPHGHEVGWAPVEIGAYIDSQLLNKPALPVVTVPMEKGEAVSAHVTSKEPISGATFEYTTAAGDINKLEWQSIPATVSQNATLSVTATLPTNVRIYFFTVKAADGSIVSSPVVIKR